jgi:glycosyltransferase involved in cell wall biosynthesis
VTRLAIVHDYLNQAGGAERVVESFHRMWPEAPIFTTIADRGAMPASLRDADLRLTWMQRLPAWKRHFRAYLPLYPLAIEGMDLRGYDVVVSSSSAWAKAVRAPAGAVHVCYCHTPMRWVWDYEHYVEREAFGVLARLALPPVIAALRAWDVRTAQRPTHIVVNSRVVQDRVQRCWGRTSEVLHPPVETERFPVGTGAGGYHLVVSRLAHYKRIDLAVTAFTRLGLPLVVIGDGPARASLEALAGPSVTFRGRVDDAGVAEAMRDCRALIFPGEEDFGITPLEANASGRPVVAFAAGGALETVRDGVTGVLFANQTAESLSEAVQRAEAVAWNAVVIRRHAESFSAAEFEARFRSIVERAAHGHHRIQPKVSGGG